MVASDRRKREDRGEDLVEIALVWRSGKQADWRQVLDSTFMTFCSSFCCSRRCSSGSDSWSPPLPRHNLCCYSSSDALALHPCFVLLDSMLVLALVLSNGAPPDGLISAGIVCPGTTMVRWPPRRHKHQPLLTNKAFKYFLSFVSVHIFSLPTNFKIVLPQHSPLSSPLSICRPSDPNV